MKTQEKASMATGPRTGFLGSFIDNLLGRNVDRTVEQQLRGLMQAPIIKQYGPENTAGVEGFLLRALRRNKNKAFSSEDVPQSMLRSKNRRQLLTDLESGRAAVDAERGATSRARLGLGLGLGGAASLPVFLSDDQPTTKNAATDDQNSVLPTIAAGTAGIAPTAQGLSSGALRFHRPTGKVVTEAQELAKHIQAGDIILSGDPTLYPIKVQLGLLGSDPHGYHVEVASGKPRGKQWMTTEAVPSSGAAKQNVGPLNARDVHVMRLKNPEHVKQMQKNLRDFVYKQDVLEDVLGPEARASTYDIRTGVRAGLKSFLPNLLRRAIPRGKPTPGHAVCSSLIGQTCPVDLAPGIPKEELLPHHIQKSDLLEPVATFKANRTGTTKFLEGLLKASPWLLRGAIGTGLGYGAYKGVRALTD